MGRIVLPMSRPVLAVISLLSIMTAWKDFLWPLIALSDPELQPLSVALPRLAQNTDLRPVTLTVHGRGLR